MNVSRTLIQWLAACLLVASVTTAQGQAFRRVYAPVSSYARDLVQTADGGFFLVGGVASDSTMLLQRTDPAGFTTWVQHPDLNGARGVATCKAHGAGFVVLGENYLDGNVLKNMVLKLDDTGAQQWLTSIPNHFLPNGLKDIIATADGAYLAVGDTRDSTLKQNAWLVKISASGAILWEKSIGLPSTLLYTSRLVEMPNGDIVISGTKLVSGNRDFFLARTDASGNLLWLNTYNKTYYQLAYDLAVTSDGGLVLLGDTYQTNPTQLSVLRTDGNGAEIWYKQYYPGTSQGSVFSTYVANCFAMDDGGNLYIPVLNGYGGQESHVLVKLNNTGDFVWEKPIGGADIPYHILITADNQFAIAGETSTYISAVLLKTDGNTPIPFSNLNGQVYWDKDQDCMPQTNETDVANLFIVEARNLAGELYYKLINSTDGTFNMPVSTGDFELTVRSAISSVFDYWVMCDTPTVNVPALNTSIAVPPIGIQSNVVCPYLDVSVGSGLMRRCTTTTYSIGYCNYGNSTAENAYVAVTADPLLQYENSSIPLASGTGNTYTFNLGDLAPGDCGAFNIKFLVSCNAQLGQTICVDAHIYPDSVCAPSNSQWDGSNIKVSSFCNGNANFVLSNVGKGDMSGPSEYVIIEDQIVFMQVTEGNFQLEAGEDTTLIIPNPAGKAYYLQTEQQPGFPLKSLPAAGLQLCNGTGNSNLLLQFPINGAEPYLATYCDEVVGSFDPNDKRGFPLGLGAEHFIDRGQEIDYMIRFQNTGNDTAFLVVILDTLPAQLDPASVRFGPGSHPYKADLKENGVLSFSFNNILLPDSTTNEPGSHGFVQFRIQQKPDLPIGTVIRNDAAIYFDFNDPVITNTAVHTIGEPLSIVAVDQADAAGLGLKVSPNPFALETQFQVSGLSPNSVLRLALFDGQGRLLRQEQFTGETYRFRRDGLEPGLYFFQLQENEGKMASGKLIIR